MFMARKSRYSGARRILTLLTHTIFGDLYLIFAAALGVSVLKLLYELLRRATYEMAGPVTWDTPIYWAVGRGMLKGLKPYIDLYDMKPPGIFYLSELSFGLSGTPFLGHALSAFTVFAIPAITAATAWRVAWHKRETNGYERAMKGGLVLLAFAWGGVAALYAAERSGEYQVELFGAFFAMLYVWAITERRLRPARWVSTLFLAILLMLPVFFKEPFLLTCLGCALLVSQKPAELFRLFLKPALIGGALGATIMMAGGYLNAYIHVYLLDMTGRFIVKHGPVWERTAAWKVLWKDISAFDPALAWSVAAFIFLSVLVAFQKPSSGKEVAWRCGSLLLSVLCAATAVGSSGDYFNHHFVFAVPICAAISISVLEASVPLLKMASVRAGLCLCSVIVLCAIWMLPWMDFAGRMGGITGALSSSQAAANEIDRVLTACKWDRYLYLGGNGVDMYGFTQHPPLGPLFIQQPYFMGQSFLRDSVFQNLYSTNVLVLRGYNLGIDTESVRTYIDTHFTKTYPPCAGLRHPLPSIYTLYFRAHP